MVDSSCKMEIGGYSSETSRRKTYSWVGEAYSLMEISVITF